MVTLFVGGGSLWPSPLTLCGEKMEEKSKDLSTEDYKDILKMQKELKLTEREIEGFLEFYKLKKPKLKILNGGEKNDS